MDGDLRSMLKYIAASDLVTQNKAMDIREIRKYHWLQPSDSLQNSQCFAQSTLALLSQPFVKWRYCRRDHQKDDKDHNFVTSVATC